MRLLDPRPSEREASVAAKESGLLERGNRAELSSESWEESAVSEPSISASLGAILDVVEKQLDLIHINSLSVRSIKTLFQRVIPAPKPQ